MAELLVRVQGRHLLWGWLQERRKAGSYDYSGCMTVSRVLYIKDNRLVQLPVPEVRAKAPRASGHFKSNYTLGCLHCY